MLTTDLGREGERIPVTLSFGLAEHRQGHTLEGTIAEAERALLQAHGLGPNHTAVGGPGLGGASLGGEDREEVPE
jgi:GGDEF domain-containing protein